MAKKKTFIKWETLQKAVAGEVNAQEQQELDCWLNASESNQRYFMKAKSYYANKDNELEDEADSVRAWQEFRGLIEPKRTKRMMWLGWTAAASIAIIIFVGYSILNYTLSDNNIAVNTPILPSSKDVVLTLSDGSEVKISSQDSQIIQSPEKKVIATNGEVTYYEDGQISSKPVIHTVSVPSGTTFKVVLSDSTVVHLNARTKLYYPVQFANDKRELTIEGEAFFEVKKGERPFIVNAQDCQIQVLGTRFNVNTNHLSDDVSTTLISGSVLVNSASNNQVVLLPGQQAISRKDGVIELAKVNVNTVIDWYHGLFVYEQETLGNILEELAQWYEVDVEYDGEDLKTLRFTGSLKRNEAANKLLDYFQKTKTVSFSTHSGKISVHHYH